MRPERDLPKVARTINEQGVPWVVPRFVTEAEIEASGAAMETIPTLLDLVRSYGQIDLGGTVVRRRLADHARFTRTRAQAEAKREHGYQPSRHGYPRYRLGSFTNPFSSMWYGAVSVSPKNENGQLGSDSQLADSLEAVRTR